MIIISKLLKNWGGKEGTPGNDYSKVVGFQVKTNKNTYKLLACISSCPWKDVMVLAASAQGDPFVPLETYPLLWYSTVLSDSGVGGGLGPLPAPRGSDSRIIWVKWGFLHYSLTSGWAARQQGFGGHQNHEVRRGWIVMSSWAHLKHLQGEGGQYITFWG